MRNLLVLLLGILMTGQAMAADTYSLEYQLATDARGWAFLVPTKKYSFYRGDNAEDIETILRIADHNETVQKNYRHYLELTKNNLVEESLRLVIEDLRKNGIITQNDVAVKVKYLQWYTDYHRQRAHLVVEIAYVNREGKDKVFDFFTHDHIPMDDHAFGIDPVATALEIRDVLTLNSCHDNSYMDAETVERVYTPYCAKFREEKSVRNGEARKESISRKHNP